MSDPSWPLAPSRRTRIGGFYPPLLVCVGGLEDGRAGNRRHRHGRLLDGELSVRGCDHRRR